MGGRGFGLIPMGLIGPLDWAVWIIASDWASRAHNGEGMRVSEGEG